MKIYKIPENLKTFIFDIDGTLYTSKEYVQEQIDCQIRHWAFLNKMTDEEGRKKINDFRKKWENEHGGKKISLGNTFTHFGIDIETSIKWREELLHPEKYIFEDKKLRAALTSLSEKYNLICVTNNPVKAARKTLEAAGISECIKDIVGLDTCLKSKPDPLILEKAMSITSSLPEECLAVGDRFDIDLALPLEIGMGAVLVDGAEDVCKLSSIVLNKK